MFIRSSVSNITKSYRAQKELSLRQFAVAINEKLINTDVSYATISRWEDEQAVYEPDMRLLFECLATYSDWRSRWAVECLEAMWPDLVTSGRVSFRVEIAA